MLKKLELTDLQVGAVFKIRKPQAPSIPKSLCSGLVTLLRYDHRRVVIHHSTEVGERICLLSDFLEVAVLLFPAQTLDQGQTSNQGATVRRGPS